MDISLVIFSVAIVLIQYLDVACCAMICIFVVVEVSFCYAACCSHVELRTRKIINNFDRELSYLEIHTAFTFVKAMFLLFQVSRCSRRWQ